jgi:anti-sigma factor RsiW
MCAFIVGGISGWVARGPSWPIAPLASEQPTDDAQQALPNASEVLHPVTLPGIERRHMLPWLSPKRANFEQRVPNFEQNNFKLVGAGLLPGPNGPAAFFIHEGPTGDRYTLLYSTTNASETSIPFLGGQQTGSVYWIDVDRDLAYVAGNDAICRKPLGLGDRL